MKQQPKRWQYLIDKILSGIYPAMEAMNDNELRNVRSALKKVDKTNCWWLAYRTVPVLSEIANDLLKIRYSQRRKVKRTL